MAAKQASEGESSSTSVEADLLRYEVYDWSSYSSGYHPRHILEEKPEDQSSRWLSESVRSPQYITLKLASPSIVVSVVFSKFHRPHACNVRRIRVLGGMTTNSMNCLCEGELCNDGEKESLNLRHQICGVGAFPCAFIKLEPLDTWGQTNFSLWYVQLMGSSDKYLVGKATTTLKEYQHKEAIRLCLKHLRQYDYQEAYHALAKQAHLDLEDPLLTELHTSLVDKGDHSTAEKLLAQAAGDGLLDEYILSLPRTAKWQKINGNQVSVHSWPSIRGGHQLCVDSANQMLYLFGGWDGGQDLADLWAYDIQKKEWVCLCKDASEEGGPSPRSCHKICLDIDSQNLYVLGKYLDQETRTSLFTVTVPGDFYSYHIPTDSWTMLSEDTQADGGPRLLFDHQMCFNPHDKSLYVFGGKVITSLLQEGIGTTIFSGLYKYNTVEKKWVCLRPDYTGGVYPHQPVPRMAHVMVMHVEKQNLYILGGQRDKQPLSDMWVYNIPNDSVTSLADGKTVQTPAAGFTVRATLEPELGEIFLHLGMTHRENGSVSSSMSGASSAAGIVGDNNSNSLWVYTINDRQWSLVASSSPLPCPRFAHQLVYEPSQRVHYMFGGNPGKGQNVQTRLDDLWTMKVEQQSCKKLLHQAVYEIRRQRYLELVVTDGAEALRYLKTELAECVDHNHKEQSEEFRKLTAELFTNRTTSTPSSSAEPSSTQCTVTTYQSTREARSQLFDRLSSYFPENQSQPRDNIINLIKY